MSEVNCIKTLRNEKGLSISAVATAMKVNWRTAKKYGDGDQLPQEKIHLKKGMMYTEKWGEIIIDWLEEDSKVKKKLRRTNKKMVEDLQAMGFKGSYRTVPRARNYVKLYCIVYWDSFKVITHEGEILFSDARPYMKKRRFIPWKDILKDWLKKPRVVGHSRYTPYLPTRIQEYLKVPSLALRKQRINELITLLVNHDMKEIDLNFYEYLAKISEEQEHPYGVNWTDYDALSSNGKEDTAHE